MAEFPVTVKRRNSIGKVVTVSCSTVKDALKILKRFQESGYRNVWIEEMEGHIVDESEFLNAPRP
jgi:predicted nucleotidyltransferase